MLLKSRPLILKILIGHHKNLGLSLWISRPFIIKPRPVNLDHENKSRVLVKMAFHNKISVWNFSFSCSRYLNRPLAEWHINAAWCKKKTDGATGLNKAFLLGWTDYPMETMLSCKRWILDRTSEKLSSEKNQDIKSLCDSWNNLKLLYLD